MPKLKHDPKVIMPVYLKKSKIEKIKKYAISKDMKGQSEVVDIATDLLFEKS